MSNVITLIVALIALVLWIVFTFVLPVGVGAIHLLLAVGTTLLVRWWAVRGSEG
jgi:hypothetical protein